MYICLCNGITDRDIRDCMRQGACCMADLQRELGVATQCGHCESYAHELLAEREHEHAAQTPGAQPFISATIISPRG